MDYHASGLMFFTNDGHWMHQIMHPSNGLTREYAVRLDRPLEIDHMRHIVKGIHVEGTLVQPLHVGWLQPATGEAPEEFRCNARIVM